MDGNVVLTEANWLPERPSFWFWECGSCCCAFGPLGTPAQAEQGKREHIAEAHSRSEAPR